MLIQKTYTRIRRLTIKRLIIFKKSSKDLVKFIRSLFLHFFTNEIYPYRHELYPDEDIAVLVFNPFHANVPFLYPLETSENMGFPKVFRGYRYGTLALNWFNRLLKHNFNTVDLTMEFS